MAAITVTWRGGVWWIGLEGDIQPIDTDVAALDERLAALGATRADLDFGGISALKQKFVHDFGPITGR
jgi:hypothetical protein